MSTFLSFLTRAGTALVVCGGLAGCILPPPKPQLVAAPVVAPQAVAPVAITPVAPSVTPPAPTYRTPYINEADDDDGLSSWN